MMSTLPDSVPAVLTPDDVLPAELVADTAGYMNAAIDHIDAFHRISGSKIAAHDSPDVWWAVARFTAPPVDSMMQSGVGTVEFAQGFTESPSWHYGQIPGLDFSGYYLSWRMPRQSNWRVLVTYCGTPTALGNEWLPRVLAQRWADAAILVLNADVTGADSHGNTVSIVPTWMRDLKHITIAIHEVTYG